MVASVDPIYSRLGEVSAAAGTTFGAAILTATGDYTGASANHVLVWTSNTTNGGLIERIRFTAIGTNIATVMRIYINNGSVNTSAANNVIYGQISLPATTASNTAATTEVDYVMGIALNPGFRIYCGVATTVASGWVGVGIGGIY